MGEESNFYYFGTPLPTLERPDGAVTAKRQPIRPEDQIVTDENGKRRFHGAFTGGFSAGYWNTVGSQEGWTPQSFKSSRSEKAPQRQQQRPEDFMDDEDQGEFGIAPKKVQVRKEFAMDSISNETESKTRKRKLEQPNCGPIPGQPVLCQLLKNVDVESVAVRILKQWGWRPGRGVGPRQTRKEKLQSRERNKREMYVLERYGCEMETQTRKPIGYDDSDEDVRASSDSQNDESEDDGITYAPEDFEPVPAIKENRYGLGYTPLSREAVLAQDILAQPQRASEIFEVVDKNNIKFSISGQAFGVGALEDDDDEEVYHREDWSKYDFSLEDEKRKRKESQKNVVIDNTVLDGFVPAKKDYIYKPEIFKVNMPPDFRPRNWAQRRSRFEPLDSQRLQNLQLEGNSRKSSQTQNVNITPEQRGQLLGETPKMSIDAPTTSSQAQQEIQRQKDEKAKALLEQITNSSNFTTGGIITAEGDEKNIPTNDDPNVQIEQVTLLEKARNKTKHLACGNSSGFFKPFVGDDAKQKRYEQFLNANLKTEDEISKFLRDIQPVHLSEWDREMEKKEFIQARNIYKPLGGVMSDRFVSETAIETEKIVEESNKKTEKSIIMHRSTSMWKPSSLLCKRYNIAEPYGGTLPEEKKTHRSKLSIFDYLETSVNKKSDFQTPVIIPKHIEKPKPIIKEAPTPLVTESKIIAPLPSSTTTSQTTATTTSTAEMPTTSSARSTQVKGFVARTELQKRVVDSIDKPASDKLELFKAIFDDSDEDEIDETNTNENNQIKGDESILESTLTASIVESKSAAAANILRNTSPPRGIFAALFNVNTAIPPSSTERAALAQPENIKIPIATDAIAEMQVKPKIAFKSRNERALKDNSDSTAMDTNADVYGPRLPERPVQNDDDVEAKILQFLQKHKNQAVEQKQKDDEWVERKLDVPESESSDSESDSSGDNSDSSATNSDKNKVLSKYSKKHKKKSAQKLKKHKSKNRHKKHSMKSDKRKSKKAAHKSKKSKKSTK